MGDLIGDPRLSWDRDGGDLTLTSAAAVEAADVGLCDGTVSFAALPDAFREKM